MRKLTGLVGHQTGGYAPGVWGPRPSRFLIASVFAIAAIGCGKKEETRTLEPVQLGMTSDMGSSYEDGELSLYQVGKPVPFPVRQPTPEEAAEVAAQPYPPYPHIPFLQSSDIRVQITWTLTNLDPESRNVEILIDPWNEFGRYFPGMVVVDVEDEEQLPNFSGIQIMFEVPGTEDGLGRSSRRHGTFTFEDMRELAIDFAAVMNVIQNAGPIDPMSEDNPAAGLANHMFNVENRSYKDVLATPYIPQVVPGLTGIDLGLRTYEPSNVAIEIVVEVVDTGNERVITDRDSDEKLMPEPTAIITAGM